MLEGVLFLDRNVTVFGADYWRREMMALELAIAVLIIFALEFRKEK